MPKVQTAIRLKETPKYQPASVQVYFVPSFNYVIIYCLYFYFLPIFYFLAFFKKIPSYITMLNKITSISFTNLPSILFCHVVLTLVQPRGGWNPPISRFLPRHRHKNQPIDSKLSDFQFFLSRHNLTKNQVHNLSGSHVITLLSEALCFITYLSLYFSQYFHVLLFFSDIYI